MARRRLIEAVRDALAEEMERDPRVVIYGEDVELSIVGDMRGLHERFGHDRISNTPICEAALTGMAVGLASAGYRPHLCLDVDDIEAVIEAGRPYGFEPVSPVQVVADGPHAGTKIIYTRAPDNLTVGLMEHPAAGGSPL